MWWIKLFTERVSVERKESWYLGGGDWRRRVRGDWGRVVRRIGGGLGEDGFWSLSEEFWGGGSG